MKTTIMTIAALACGLAATAELPSHLPNPTLLIERDDTPVDAVSYFVSTDGSRTLQPNYFALSDNGQSVDATLTIDPSTKYQEIDGFGFAITGSAAYNLLKMSAANRNSFLRKVFSHTDGYGCSYVRIPIGCSDFSLSEYTCCDTPGIGNFALTDEETKYIIPVMKEILAINPGVKVMSAPWTAPLWMKTNGQWTGGNLKRESYQDYATYFVKWIQAFKANGINITAVTPQNEPLNRGNSASMFMGWDEQRDFIKTALGPALRQNGLSTQIWVYDHNYNYDNMADQQSYPTKIYADADAAQYITGAAYHNYGGYLDELSKIHNANPDKQLLFTEWTAGTWSHGVGISEVIQDTWALVLGIVKNWGRGAMVWNLMLDANRGPYRPGGCSTGNGAVDIDSSYSRITYNSFYYAMCLPSAVVKPGARRIGSSGSTNGLQFEAFRNADGTNAIVGYNESSKPLNLRINDGVNTFVVNIPVNTVAGFRW